MTNVQIITLTIDRGEDGLVIGSHVYKENNVRIEELDVVARRARTLAAGTIKSSRGMTLPAQHILLSEEPFPCYGEA